MSLANLRKAITSRNTDVKEILAKSKKMKKSISKSKAGSTLYEKIKNLCDQVEKRLSNYIDAFECIDNYDRLCSYIDKAVANGYIAIDTETTGLDPITDEIVGACIYTPDEKPAYIPINHISLITNARITNQLTSEQVATQFRRLIDNKTKAIFFNAKFDIRVMRHQLGINMPCYWDASIAAKVLKFNEEEQNLKYLWKKYCSNNKDEAHFTFDKMFQGYCFNIIPIKTAYLYAAKDAIMTWELYKFQEPYLTSQDQKCKDCNFERLAYVFHNIENPIISVVADIEDNGIKLDKSYAEQLSQVYHKKLDEQLDAFYKELENYKDQVVQWRNTHPQTKIQDPLNIGSPTQLAELFYDVLKLEPVSKKQPRGTGEDILLKLNHPLSKLILDYRGTAKLLSTYIDKMPEVVNPKTGKIHCSFNQIGADTSRFSSSNPNMQNIPSHCKDIRKMFIASDGYVLVGADFSKQEPTIAADLSRDEKFIADIKAGRDPYSSIASIAFQKPYEDCLEFYPDGSKNSEGKERRSAAKAIFLGICYSKQIPSIANDLNISPERAQEIYDQVMVNMPGLKTLIDESQEMARQYGFVETKWGTRKYIPDMQLSPYEISIIGTKNFDPFFDSEELGVVDDVERLKRKYLAEISNCKFRKDKQKIKDRAEKDGFKIKDNTYFIEEASRQCLNGRIQGSAANQTKIAMQIIANNSRLKELGFRILLLVHDEIIGECPVENVKEAEELFTQCMLASGKDLCAPVKVDSEVTVCWYGKVIKTEELSQEEIIQEYNRLKNER